MKKIILLLTSLLTVTICKAQNYDVVKIANYTNCDIIVNLEFFDILAGWDTCQDIQTKDILAPAITSFMVTKDDINNSIGFFYPGGYSLPGTGPGFPSGVSVSRMKVATDPSYACFIGTDIGDCTVQSHPYTCTTNYVVGNCSVCAGVNQIKVRGCYDTPSGIYFLIIEY